MSEDRSNYRDYDVVENYDQNIVDICGGDLSHYKEIIRLLLRDIHFLPESNVLELACGTGISSEILLEHDFARLYCLDHSMAMLEATEYRLSKYGAHWRFVGDRFQLENEIKERGEYNYSLYYPLAAIPRTTLLLYDLYKLDNLVLPGTESQVVDFIVMANTWNSLVNPAKLAEAAFHRLVPQGIFIFNTKVKTELQVSLQKIVEQEFYLKNNAETNFSGDKTDLTPFSTVSEVKSILEQSGFMVDSFEQDFFLSNGEAQKYLQAAVQRFVRNYYEIDGVTKIRVNNLRFRLERTTDEILEKQHRFFWRREAFFKARKL